MRQLLGLVMVPYGAVVDAHLKKVLDQHLPGAEVEPFVCRISRAQLRSPKMPPNEQFVEDAGNKAWLHDLNPFPRLSAWTIGGKFAGCLKNFGSGSSIQVSSQELASLENNSVLIRDFNYKFYPDVLIDLNGHWISNPNGVSANESRYGKRMRRALEASANNATLVVVEITMDNVVEQNTLFV